MTILATIKTHLKNAVKPLIVVLGPTGSGKTDLSLYIAENIDGEIISTDSRQIYRKMPISTDVIGEEEREGIPHHLLEVVEPDETLTLKEYRDLALGKIDEIYARGKVPMLVGGTGLYISSIVENYDLKAIEPNWELRAELESEAAKYGNEYLYAKLLKVDPESAKSIHPNNLPYVIRALEINITTGRNKINQKSHSEFDTFMIGINWPREELYQRIGLRVDRQIERGVVDEVKGLLSAGYSEKLPSMSSLGIKEYIPYIRGEKSLEECVETLKMNTRRYGKRQITWFKRYPNIHWITPEQLCQIKETKLQKS